MSAERGGGPAVGRRADPPASETCDGFAKVNLRLRVFPRDETGFHPVETLLLRADLRDRVEVRPGGAGIRLAVEWEGPAEPLPEGPENLVWRAAEAFFRAVGSPPAADIRLRKRIPVGTGLGGGSADGAATLRALNRCHGEPLDEEALLAAAGELGSDVPFGLLPGPAALAWERGRRLLPLPAPPSRPALVAVPPFRVATAAAYGWLSPAPGPAAALPAADRLADWSELARLAGNDFEGAVLARHPPLEDALGRLRGTAPTVALLAGSGASLFAVYPDEAGRARGSAALEPLGREGWRLLPTRIPPEPRPAAG